MQKNFWFSELFFSIKRKKGNVYCFLLTLFKNLKLGMMDMSECNRERCDIEARKCKTTEQFITQDWREELWNAIEHEGGEKP